MKEIFSANMSSGPQLYSFRNKIFFYGAYYLLTYIEDDRGKELKVTVVDATYPVCWIELWSAAYDGHDWVRWTTERGQIALASSGDKPQINPSLIWEIQPGNYTLYFVNSKLTRETRDEWINFQIEVV